MTKNKSYEQQDPNLVFLAYKGFDVNTVKGLTIAKKWLETADPDDLMYGEPTGDPIDIFAGSMRRCLLIKSVDAEIRRLSAS
ncbi:MAG: hypothetical protein J5956_06685 [Ruminococcus sp.]|nr:hypothetical protein [Ruminococcus sp.]